jgi:hypothetical protein
MESKFDGMKQSRFQFLNDPVNPANPVIPSRNNQV